MLIRKMLREIRQNFGQFFSLFILSMLAITMFTVLKSSNVGANQAMEEFHKKTNLADGWIYGEAFTQKDQEAVEEISRIKGVSLRTELKARAVKQKQAQIMVFLEKGHHVSKPYVMEGREFDSKDTKHIWLSQRFAKAWKLKPGDRFAFEVEGKKVEKEIAGLIASPEFEYMTADTDLETDFSAIGYVYLSSLPYEKIIPYTQMLIQTKDKQVLQLEPEIRRALHGNYSVFVDRSSIPGLKVFADELEQHEQFAYGFTTIFVLIALLVIMTTMSRLVAQQRTQIGTLNAMGMSVKKIRQHYLGYSFGISILGAVAGLLIGPLIFGQIFTELFQKFYTLPNWKASYDGSFFIAVIVVVASCTAASYFSCRKLLRVKPSEALRPAAPRKAKECLLEKLPIWKYFHFETQYNLRDISRAKLRAFMGVFGTACGMMIMLAGLACMTTMNQVYDWSFSKLQHSKYLVQYTDNITLEQANKISAQYHGEQIMGGKVEIALSKKDLAKDRKATNLVVTEGQGLYGITDQEQKVIKLPAGTIGISSKLAQHFQLKKGDWVDWHVYGKNLWIRSKIGAITRNPTSSGIIIQRKDYEKTNQKFIPTMFYTNEAVTHLEDHSSFVAAVHTNQDMKKAFQSAMEVMYDMVYVFVAFAAILIITVLYNAGNLSFNERIREFATLKVMGFESRQIRKIISIQNLWLSLAGVLCGAPFGRLLLQYMFDSNGDSFDYEAVASASDYLMSGVFVLGISVFVSFLFAKRIKKLDMVGSLKGME